MFVHDSPGSRRRPRMKTSASVSRGSFHKSLSTGSVPSSCMGTAADEMDSGLSRWKEPLIGHPPMYDQQRQQSECEGDKPTCYHHYHSQPCGVSVPHGVQRPQPSTHTAPLGPTGDNPLSDTFSSLNIGEDHNAL